MKNICYCYKCKKYYDGETKNDNFTDSQGFSRCPNCLEVGFSILTLIYYGKADGYSFDVQDELVFPFRNIKDFNRTIKIMRKMFYLSKQRLKEEKRIKHP